MKKTLVALLTTVAIAVLSVMPVFATEGTINAESALLEKKMAGFSNAISTLVTYDNVCGEKAQQSIHAIVDAVQKDVYASNVEEQKNFVRYLEACVGNMVENERVKKQNVGAMADVVKVNPSFQPQLDKAIVEYNEACVAHQAALNAVAAAKDYFVALNAQFAANAAAKAALDTQAIY